MAACRTVLFSTLVDDPDSDLVYRRLDGSVDEERAGIKRAELFNLIEETEGLNPVKIYVEDFFVRAAIGGTGEAKTAANYAASLLAAEEAKKKGFTQVLWLDAAERKYIEEVGTMNMFFRIDDEVITAPLNGSILPGVTRDSVIRIVKDWGLKMTERSLAIDEVIAAAEDGRLQEAFGTGTAAVISPVGQITFKGRDYVVAGGKMGELSQKLYDEIVAIQYGQKPDPYGWVTRIG